MKKNFNASIVSIGAELLKGSTVNTNAAFLGKHLTRLGFTVQRVLACDDKPHEICCCLRDAFKISDLVIASGGLGPTPDDVTRQAIAEFYRVPLRLSLTQWRRIIAVYKKLGKTLPESVRQEALYPSCARPLINHDGIALGFSVQSKNQMLIVLPGVPHELENLFKKKALGVIRKAFPNRPKFFQVIARTVGLSEPAIMENLGKDFFDTPFDFGIYPHAGEVTLRLGTEEAVTARRLKSKVSQRLGNFIYSYAEKSLSSVILESLQARGETLTVAESCTGGLLSSLLTAEPGASCAFKGAVVCYNNTVKSIVGVTRPVLRTRGAVSAEAAQLMACGVREKLNSTYGLSITGIAGPSGASAKKPVGLVYIALATRRLVSVHRHEFLGDREQIRRRSTMKALEYLWRELQI